MNWPQFLWKRNLANKKNKTKTKDWENDSDNANLHTSLLPCLKESLQKEQRYKTWKSISSIYRRHPHFKTNTQGNPPIFSNRWYTTENKVHSKTDRQLYWWTEVSIGHSHDRTPTQQDLRVTLNRTPTLVEPTIAQKSYFCKLAMDSLASSSTWSCIWRIYISWDLWTPF